MRDDEGFSAKFGGYIFISGLIGYRQNAEPGSTHILEQPGRREDFRHIGVPVNSGE
jgi:hypothetical protein